MGDNSAPNSQNQIYGIYVR